MRRDDEAVRLGREQGETAERNVRRGHEERGNVAQHRFERGLRCKGRPEPAAFENRAQARRDPARKEHSADGAEDKRHVARIATEVPRETIECFGGNRVRAGKTVRYDALSVGMRNLGAAGCGDRTVETSEARPG